MAIVTKVKIQPAAVDTIDGTWAAVPYTILTSSDTMVGWEEGVGQILFLFNPTGGTLNVLFQGVGIPAGIPVDGFGNRIFFDDGIAITLTAGQTKVVPLDTIPLYFRGATAINITGGTGAYCALIEPVPTGVSNYNG